MSISSSVPRVRTKSVSAAIGGLLATVAIFVVVFLAFLMAPLLLLGAALLAYVALRPRTESPARHSGVAVADPTHPALPAAPSDFGTGVS